MNELKLNNGKELNDDELNNEDIDYLVDLVDKEISTLITARNQRTLSEDGYKCERKFLDILRSKLESKKVK